MHGKQDYSIGKVSNIDIRLLSVFITVVESGGLTQAQEPLNIALSSISTSVQDLETRLGLKLCNRGRGGFSLTENGREVYHQARKLFQAVDHFNANVAGLKGRFTGELKIGILDNSTMSPTTRVPEVIHRFSEQHPDVHISIKVLPSNEIEEALVNGSLNLGIGLFPDSKQTLRALVSFPVVVDLYCGNQSPLFTRDDISIRDLVLTGYAKGCYSPDPRGKLLQQLPTPPASSYLSEGLAFLILSGRYIGHLPRRYAANWVKNGEMRALPQAQFSHELELSLVVRRGETVGPIMRAFLDIFSAFAEE
ncbi:LysR family transcriptional regulator [Marinobacterium rhizophilum]|uniref:LysR family transcriptional regulator n=1 Tax=Marinobacterium rhizophilum TaxID=420402 RepID=A0ABY5HKV5_9GAMM|nr:LysR family transcriptional regulator [Marinobacterium rhizophilum]UTW11855.1 LysR family transcriptional regulator [Marinobacterium rhizophilum]